MDILLLGVHFIANKMYLELDLRCVFIFLIFLALGGCSSTLSVREVDQVPVSSAHVLKLTDYPANRNYRIISTIEITAYRAGLSQPTPDAVWDEVSKEISARGGNACLLRGRRPDDIWKRRIWITCEVLAVSDVVN